MIDWFGQLVLFDSILDTPLPKQEKLNPDSPDTHY